MLSRAQAPGGIVDATDAFPQYRLTLSSLHATRNPHTIAPHHVVTTRARARPYPAHVYGPEAHVDAPEAVVHGH
jgi:hypothetical protein